MEIIYVIMLVFMIGMFSIISFLLGAYVAIGKGNSKLNLNPIEAIKEHKENKQSQEEYKLTQKQLNTMLENIDNYPYGQKEIPNE